VRRPPSSGRVRVAMCGRPDVSRRQTFQILRDEVYSCKEIHSRNALLLAEGDRLIDRLLGFTNDTTRMLRNSAMLGPSHPDTKAR